MECKNSGHFKWEKQITIYDNSKTIYMFLVSSFFLSFFLHFQPFLSLSLPFPFFFAFFCLCLCLQEKKKKEIYIGYLFRGHFSEVETAFFFLIGNREVLIILYCCFPSPHPLRPFYLLHQKKKNFVLFFWLFFLLLFQSVKKKRKERNV